MGLPPLRFGIGGRAKGHRQAQPLAGDRKRKQTQPLARARTGGIRSASASAQKRKRVDKVSATGEAKRSRKMQPHERRQEHLSLGQKRSQPLARQQSTCRWFDPKVCEADHFASHREHKGFCIRCDLHRNRRDYEACAMLDSQQSWLSIGAHGGAWGMGCTVCAAAEPLGARIGSRRSKFARFQIRPSSRFRAREALLQHATSVSHRRALGFHRPQPLARNAIVQRRSLSSLGICSLRKVGHAVDVCTLGAGP